MAQDPVSTAYTLTVVVNSLNLMVLWLLSGITRGRTMTTMNPEDAAMAQRRGASVIAVDPPEVARVLRAHRNAFDNTIPFLLLGFVFAAHGPDRLEAQILFGVFTGARLLYSVAYLKGLQPWRTISYLVGFLTTFVLMFEVCRLALS
jgi:prostaglandin-E synthase 1